MDASNSAISCHLLSSNKETNNTVCSIKYGPSPGNCDGFTNFSSVTTGRPGVNLTIHLSQDVNNQMFCYAVSLKYGITKIKIVGNFTECNLIIKTLNRDSYDASMKKDSKSCNCYVVWSQSTQVCEEQLQDEIIKLIS